MHYGQMIIINLLYRDRTITKRSTDVPGLTISNNSKLLKQRVHNESNTIFNDYIALSKLILRNWAEAFVLAAYIYKLWRLLIEMRKTRS